MRGEDKSACGPDAAKLCVRDDGRVRARLCLPLGLRDAFSTTATTTTTVVEIAIFKCTYTPSYTPPPFPWLLGSRRSVAASTVAFYLILDLWFYKLILIYMYIFIYFINI